MDLWKEQSVTIGSIPLPAGASTEAKQDTGNSSLSAINTAIGAQLFVSSNSDIALVTIQLNPALSAGLTYSAVSNSAVEEASGNGTITVTSKGAILFSIIVTQNTVMNEDIFEEDFLSHLGMSIADVSDQIVLCITPITSGITAYGCMQYKEY